MNDITRKTFYFFVFAFLVSCDYKITSRSEGPIMLCTQGICLLYAHNVIDKDGDQVSDEDELALSSDALSLSNTPDILTIARAIQNSLLPSFNKGLSEIIVLPDYTPIGVPLSIDKGPIDLSKIREMKENLIKILGLTSDQLKNLNIDPSRGLRLQIDKAGEPTRKRDGTLGRVTMRYSGLLISNTHKPTTKSKNESDGSVTTTSTFSPIRTEIGHNNYEVKRHETKTNQKGNPNGDADQTTTTTITRTTERDGKEVTKETRTIVESKTIHPDGSEETIVVDVKESSDSYTKVSYTKTKDKDGNEKISNKRTCKGSNQDDALENCVNGYVDAENQEYEPIYVPILVIGRVPDVERVIKAKLGVNTTPGPTVNGPSTNPGDIPLKYSGDINPLIALVDESNFTLIILSAPRINKAQPRKDPRLPDILNDILP